MDAHTLAFTLTLTLTAGGDFHGLAVDHPGLALDDLDAVLLEERTHTAGQSLHDAVFPCHRALNVDLRHTHANAERRCFGVLQSLVEFLGNVNQGLGRNATDVQAGAAQLLALDQHGRDAELSRADRCDIAPRAAADDQQALMFDLAHAHSTKSRAGCSSCARTAWMNSAA